MFQTVLTVSIISPAKKSRDLLVFGPSPTNCSRSTARWMQKGLRREYVPLGRVVLFLLYLFKVWPATSYIGNGGCTGNFESLGPYAKFQVSLQKRSLRCSLV